MVSIILMLLPKPCTRCGVRYSNIPNKNANPTASLLERWSLFILRTNPLVVDSMLTLSQIHVGAAPLQGIFHALHKRVCASYLWSTDVSINILAKRGALKPGERSHGPATGRYHRACEPCCHPLAPALALPIVAANH